DDLVDPDDTGGLDLLGLPQGTALLGVDTVDAGLAAGHHAVDDPLALRGPARHRGRGTELQVVGVGHHAEHRLPSLVDVLPRLVGHGPIIAAPRWREKAPGMGAGCPPAAGTPHAVPDEGGRTPNTPEKGGRELSPVRVPCLGQRRWYARVTPSAEIDLGAS